MNEGFIGLLNYFDRQRKHRPRGQGKKELSYMGNRRLSGEERRQQIIDNARKVFAQMGYAGARIRDIAESCGINEAMLYKHFEGKEELFLEVLGQIHEEMVAYTSKYLSPDDNGLERIRASMRGQWEAGIRDHSMNANAIHAITISMSDESIRAKTIKRWGKHHKYYLDAIEQGQKDGSIKKDIDPSMYASMTICLGFVISMFRSCDLQDCIKVYDPQPIFETILSCLDSSIED